MMGYEVCLKATDHWYRSGRVSALVALYEAIESDRVKLTGVTNLRFVRTGKRSAKIAFDVSVSGKARVLDTLQNAVVVYRETGQFPE